MSDHGHVTKFFRDYNFFNLYTLEFLSFKSQMRLQADFPLISFFKPTSLSVILIPSKRLGFLLQKRTKHDDMSRLTIEKELLGSIANSCVFIRVNPVNLAKILDHFRIDSERNSDPKGSS
jgi:hypothetical protein